MIVAETCVQRRCKLCLVLLAVLLLQVCSRLGLVSLAYLWHQPQALLLR